MTNRQKKSLISDIFALLHCFNYNHASHFADCILLSSSSLQVDKVTAQISQRTLLLILPLVFASFVTGTVAVFEQVGMMMMMMMMVVVMIMTVMKMMTMVIIYFS